MHSPSTRPTRFSASHQARVLWVLVLLLNTTGLWLLVANRHTLNGPEDVIGRLGGHLFAMGAATVGTLIVGQHPGHLVGWLLALLAVPAALYGAAAEYAVFGRLVARFPLPGLVLVSWLQGWVPSLTFPAALALLYLLFPDGRLLSRRWLSVVLLAVAASLLGVAGAMLTPGEMIVYRPTGELPLGLPNPLGWDGPAMLHNVLNGFGWLGGQLTLLGGIIALSLRFRRSSGQVRQQLKWLVFLSLLTVSGLISTFFMPAAVSAWLGEVLIVCLITSLPVGVGIAILRYQLYDIDLLIKRTLVYSALTAVLTAVYLGSVLLLQPLLGGNSQIATVLSTLAVAALFQPLRRRVQAAIDRRFYRRKYDAQRTLSAFGASLRDKVELDPLAAELLDIIQQTLEPASLSLWLRQPLSKHGEHGAQD